MTSCFCCLARRSFPPLRIGYSFRRGCLLRSGSCMKVLERQILTRLFWSDCVPLRPASFCSTMTGRLAPFSVTALAFLSEIRAYCSHYEEGTRVVLISRATLTAPASRIVEQKGRGRSGTQSLQKRRVSDLPLEYFMQLLNAATTRRKLYRCEVAERTAGQTTETRVISRELRV